MTASRRRRAETREEPIETPAAIEIAARFLGSRPRSRWEVQRRLLRAGAEPVVVEATLDRLEELGYLDDLAFARWWAEQRDRHSPRGRRMLESELRKHGVQRETIELYREEHAHPTRPPGEADALPGSESERARASLEAHLRGRAMPTERAAIQRIGMYLMRRGFDGETVRSALRDATSAPELDEPSV